MPRFERKTTSRGRSAVPESLLAHAPVAAHARLSDGQRRHQARFPTFRRTYSPS